MGSKDVRMLICGGEQAGEVVEDKGVLGFGGHCGAAIGEGGADGLVVEGAQLAGGEAVPESEGAEEADRGACEGERDEQCAGQGVRVGSGFWWGTHGRRLCERGGRWTSAAVGRGVGDWAVGCVSGVPVGVALPASYRT